MFLLLEDGCSQRECLNVNTDSAYLSKVNNVCEEISMYLGT